LVITQQVNYRELAANCGLDIKTTKTHTAVPHDYQDLFTRSSYLSPNAHAHTMADTGEGTGIKDSASVLGHHSLGDKVAGGKAI
jgi:hypothetical protein